MAPRPVSIYPINGYNNSHHTNTLPLSIIIKQTININKKPDRAEKSEIRYGRSSHVLMNVEEIECCTDVFHLNGAITMSNIKCRLRRT